MVMLATLPYPELPNAILAHSTMSEGLGELFSQVPLKDQQAVVPSLDNARRRR